MSVPVQHVLFTVFQSILQVFLLCLAGFTLSLNRIVDKHTSKALNHINVVLFTPALLFSKVAYFLTPAKLRQLWVIPIFFVVLSALSALVAYSLARACRLKRSQVNFATAASMFMNSNSLPVALMQSLVTTVPLLKWGPDDTTDAMFGRSLTYLVVFSTLGMLLRWSYGVRLLSRADEPDSPPPTAYRDAPELTPAAHPLDYESHAPRNKRVWRTRTIRTHTPLTRRYSHPYTHFRSNLPAVPTSLCDQSENEDSDDLESTEGDSEDTIAFRSERHDIGFSTEPREHLPTPAPTPSAPRWERPARPSIFKRILAMLTSLSPPLIASLLALFCVLVPPVQRLLKSAEMTPFTGALKSAGGCSVPLTLLVLGGWFWEGESKHKDPAEVDPGPNKGKRTENRRAPTHRAPQLLTTTDLDSSSASLSSLIGVFGDVLMGRIHLRHGAKPRAGGTQDTAVDAEPGLLSPPAEDTVDRAEVAHRTLTRSQGEAAPNVHTTNPPGETLTVVVTLLVRMIIVPAIVIPVIVLVSRFKWGGEIFEDPVFIVSSMLLVTSPPALTLAQISQRAKTTPKASPPSSSASSYSPFERLLSRTVFWAYLVLTPPVTIASVMLGLVLIGA